MNRLNAAARSSGAALNVQFTRLEAQDPPRTMTKIIIDRFVWNDQN